jgi:NTP pyrophosphatase (non-canonical NTP hydrolase)
MNRAEHLLSIVAEEAVEVAQRATKALRFGMGEVQPGQPHNNWQRIEFEFHDLIAALEMAHGRPLTIKRDLIDKKKAKVEKFLVLSEELGTLTSSAGNAGVRADGGQQ